MEIKLLANPYNERKELCAVLAILGYKTWTEQSKTNCTFGETDYYVCFEFGQKKDTPKVKQDEPEEAPPGAICELCICTKCYRASCGNMVMGPCSDESKANCNRYLKECDDFRPEPPKDGE